MTFILADLVDFQFEAKKELDTVYNVLIEAQGTTMRGTLCSLVVPLVDGDLVTFVVMFVTLSRRQR